MAFARWDPLRDLLAIQHRLEQLTSPAPQGWTPAVDLCETAEAFVVTAELPGLTRDQVRIDVHDGRLTLHGRRDARVCCEQYHRAWPRRLLTLLRLASVGGRRAHLG
jgi:HSP20 family molecular chaperone IbpA